MRRNYKIKYLTIGQAEEMEMEMERLERRMTAIGIISVLVISVLFITLILINKPENDPYAPAEVTRQEILQSENEKAASKMIDAQVSRGGYDIRTMEATAYSWTGNKTASGVWPEPGIVAVDPEVIPLGTQLYIEGYGPAIAADTGGDIKGDRIDLYMETDSECWEFGRQDVRVKIIEED